VATRLTSIEREQAQKWSAAAFAFVELRLNDEEFDNSLPDRVRLHPMSDYRDRKATHQLYSDYTDVYISIDNPRDFKIGASPAEPE